jgi:mono/diheme cytochrome c family protein
LSRTGVRRHHGKRCARSATAQRDEPKKNAGPGESPGSGRIGPSLIGDSYAYERVVTDVGMLEVVFGGGGAMQAFGKRISQDDILRIIAYLRSLKK